jgi:retron-type reverse transcriptase
MVLEAVYEQDFMDCSYGFRPGRSAHQALQALWHQTTRLGGGWILDVDVRKFFDTLDHSHLRQILRRRVLDGVLLRLVDKWLAAGVFEDGGITYPDAGSPQGGVVSPILANIYLHECSTRGLTVRSGRACRTERTSSAMRTTPCSSSGASETRTG